MLKNAYFDYFLAKIVADTAENERNFVKNFAKIWQLPYGSTRSTTRTPAMMLTKAGDFGLARTCKAPRNRTPSRSVRESHGKQTNQRQDVTCPVMVRWSDEQRVGWAVTRTQGGDGSNCVESPRDIWEQDRVFMKNMLQMTPGLSL